MMTTKRIFTVIGRTLLVTASLLLFMFSYVYFSTSGDEFNQIDHLKQELGKIISVFFMISLLFFATNEWLRIKNKVHKPFPYFLWIILIPILMSEVILFIIAPENQANAVGVHIETVIPVGIVSLFLGLIHFIKYNINLKKSNRSVVDLNTSSMLKKILLYAVGLSVLYSLIIFIPSYKYIPSATYNLITDLIGNFIFAIICWYLVLSFHKYLEKKGSFFTSFIITVVGIAIIMQFVFIVRLLMLGLLHGYIDIIIERFTLWNVVLGNLSATLYTIFCTLFFQFLCFSKTRAVEQKAFKAEVGKQTEKYESLRRQLSPHFLFNNINVLTALIEENPKKAVYFSESLGNIYRHFLRQEDEDVVSLESALSFSKDYLELLKYRYEEAFNYVLPERVDSDHYIIPLALQQVIENTIKHNEFSKEKPLTVVIGIQNDYLIVQNTKQLKTSIEMTKKTGIENIKNRYAFLTEKEIIIENSTTSFTIKLPLLNMENS